MNGARALLESLRHEGVEVVFGYPGGAVLDRLIRLADGRLVR